jgi:hypothetical protein
MSRLPLDLGVVCKTPRADTLNPVDVLRAIERHESGDWGNLCSEDWALNNAALVEDGLIFSTYLTRDGVEFWIITDSDRSATTVLLPLEY